MEQIEPIVESIARINGLGKIKTLERINIGFNNAICCVNNDYIIKLCTNIAKESNIQKEVSFYQQSNFDFHPKLLHSDSSKTQVPYIYLIEEFLNGKNLFDLWGSLDNEARKDVLSQLLKIMKQLHHNRSEKSDGSAALLGFYDNHLKKLNDKNILSTEKIDYLQYLRSLIQDYFKNAECCNIHGDIHFNNLIMCDGKLKLIDFENYGESTLDKEFDSINRMIRQPQSYRQKGNSGIIVSSDYTEIMPYFKENYPEVCDIPFFDERLLIYDCLNSLKWIAQFPEHELYHEVLFNKSIKLVK